MAITGWLFCFPSNWYIWPTDYMTFGTVYFRYFVVFWKGNHTMGVTLGRIGNHVRFTNGLATEISRYLVQH